MKLLKVVWIFINYNIEYFSFSFSSTKKKKMLTFNGCTISICTIKLTLVSHEWTTISYYCTKLNVNFFYDIIIRNALHLCKKSHRHHKFMIIIIILPWMKVSKFILHFIVVEVKLLAFFICHNLFRSFSLCVLCSAVYFFIG